MVFQTRESKGKMTNVPISAGEVRFFSGSSNPQLAENITTMFVNVYFFGDIWKS